jgi:hypothetical protein
MVCVASGWGERASKRETSVSISADSTSILTSAMILIISTSNPGRSAVSMQSKLIKKKKLSI